jgi:hypothetical protein
MGLDMSLTGIRYLSDYDDELKAMKVAINQMALAVRGNMEIEEIGCKVMYWRKANAIHKWFVDNCQNGVDECQRSLVGFSQVKELLALCKKVKRYKKQAPELLPTSEGFFFGGTEYDDWYFSNIQQTIDGLEKLFKIPNIDSWDFYYQSSW